MYPDLESRLLSSLCQNPGQRSHEVRVGDRPTALQIIMMLPGRTAAKVRVKASFLLTRFPLARESQLGNIDAVDVELREFFEALPVMASRRQAHHLRGPSALPGEAKGSERAGPTCALGTESFGKYRPHQCYPR